MLRYSSSRSDRSNVVSSASPGNASSRSGRSTMRAPFNPLHWLSLARGTYMLDLESRQALKLRLFRALQPCPNCFTDGCSSGGFLHSRLRAACALHVWRWGVLSPCNCITNSFTAVVISHLLGVLDRHCSLATSTAVAQCSMQYKMEQEMQWHSYRKRLEVNSRDFVYFCSTIHFTICFLCCLWTRWVEKSLYV